MAVDVRSLLGRYNIEFVESGSNVAKGNINIQCPWCGDADHSQHLGINLATGLWGCWRSAQHRGRKLSTLLVKLTGLSPSEARRECGEGSSIAVQQGDFENALSSLTEGVNPAEEVRHAAHCAFDPYMHKLTGRTRSQRRAVQYLANDRGFAADDIRRLAKRYDLHFAIHGDYANRLVIPVYEGSVLQTYLGRSIYSDAKLRYRALEAEKSVKQVKDCVYNFDHACKPGRVLFIVEGAIDAWKLDFYNYKAGCRAIGLFNMNVEEAQLNLIAELRDLYETYVIVLDSGQVTQAMQVEGMLSAFLPDLRTMNLDYVNDPGELTERQAVRLAEEVR